ncbi:unnamed protein product [Fusarium graminearum]|uniref:Chromosome 3, complete genome n=1 Tax=Gibberella zeae (strain ATCC MYA-4620 / CBS 123657 / FGSC 9075 / NRRL 31084 / PH-1) TaxID=229533 RepID=A0A098E4A8_GIBZE|nr:unnamed protein product [Fusarium graminearum]CZS83768.1 unnamed protein product [Fusarium graminearum]
MEPVLKCIISSPNVGHPGTSEPGNPFSAIKYRRNTPTLQNVSTAWYADVGCSIAAPRRKRPKIVPIGCIHASSQNKS